MKVPKPLRRRLKREALATVRLLKKMQKDDPSRLGEILAGMPARHLYHMYLDDYRLAPVAVWGMLTGEGE